MAHSLASFSSFAFGCDPRGFINFWLAKDFLYAELKNIQKLGRSFGKAKRLPGKKINIEFVSANPTGPLTVAHGRQAACGDAWRGYSSFQAIMSLRNIS